MTAPARLDDRTIVALSGPEARSFLQGLITNDTERLGPGAPLYAALLTPQGKILFDFFLVETPEAIWLDCASATADMLVKRLSLYRLRAKIEIARRDDLMVFAAWGGARLPQPGWSDPRLSPLGQRIALSAGSIPSDALPAEAYTRHRLALGVPEAGDFGQDRIFALDAGLAELHGVAFDKGCYVGQELTARMKHRGTARKRLLPVAAADGTTLLTPGASVTAGGRELGSVNSVYGARGFALIRLDRLDETGDASPEAGGISIIIEKPIWLFS
jgi:folate-binding protein YgfZ